MDSTQRRMIAVAVLVCGFAAGMAGLLNYFKYCSTSNRLVTERLAVTGNAIEDSIQHSLALGLQFADIGTLPGTLARERSADALIQGIDIFDMDGTLLYTTDSLRAARPVPKAWIAAARKADDYWSVEESGEAAAGIAILNNFGLKIGFLAVRYSGDRVREAALAVGRELAVSALIVFAASSLLSSLAVVLVMRRLGRDVTAVEAALRTNDLMRATTPAAHSPFGAALQRFMQTTCSAEREIADLRARLHRGAP